MNWTVSKCHRVVRPLQAQISQYNSAAKLYPHEIDNSVRHKKINNTGDCLYHARQKLFGQCYEYGIGVFTSFEQALLQLQTPPGSKIWTLSTLSAFEVGRCIVYTEDEFDQNTWHSALNRFDDRYRQFVCVGHAVGIIVRNAYSLRHVLPALIMHSLDEQHYLIAQKLYTALVECLSAKEFLAISEWLVRLSRALNARHIVCAKLTDRAFWSDYPERTICILRNQNLNVGGAQLEELLLKNINVVIKKNSYSALQLLEVYFSCVQGPPPVRVVAKVIRRVGASSDSSSTQCTLNKVLQLYCSYYKRGYAVAVSLDNKESSIGDVNDLAATMVALFQHNRPLFKRLIEHAISVNPLLAMEASAQFARAHTDMKTVLWQDDVSAHAMRQIASEKEVVYDNTMGVWVTPNPSSIIPSSSPVLSDEESTRSEEDGVYLNRYKKRKRSVVHHNKDSHVHIAAYDDDDDFSLIRPCVLKSRRRKKSSIMPDTNHHEGDDTVTDDILLLAGA